VGGTAIPVVPCYLAGAFEAWPKGKIVPRPRSLHLKFGEPRSYAHLQEGKESALHVSADLRNAVAALAP
jgi:1-acyl-sn-glycerol-3-phosphate acyltransferase